MEVYDERLMFDRALFEAHLQGVEWAKAELEKRGTWDDPELRNEAMHAALWRGDEGRIALLESMGISRDVPTPSDSYGDPGASQPGFPASKRLRKNILAKSAKGTRYTADSLLRQFNSANYTMTFDGLAEFYDELGMLEEGTDPASRLALAVLLNDHDKVRELIAAGVDPLAETGRGMSPLMLAVLFARASTLEMLIKAGVDPDAGNPAVDSPLLMAINKGLYEKARTLIDLGADFERPVLDSYQKVSGAALQHAARNGDRRLVSYLLIKGADVDSTAGGFTPLFMAAKWGKMDIAEMLIQYGADVDLPSANGWTAMDAAIDCWTMEALWPLREAGAKPGGRREPGETLCWNLEQALQRKNHRQAVAFVEAGEFGDGPAVLRSAIERDQEDLALALIATGVPLDEQQESRPGPRLIDIAINHGSAGIVKAMLDRGIDPNEPGPSGRSVMQSIWSMPEPEVLQVLLDAGGYIESQASLQTLAAKGDVAGVRRALGAGQKASREDGYGFRALHYAVAMGHTEVVKALLEAEREEKPRGLPRHSERHDPIGLAARFGQVDVLRLLLQGDPAPDLKPSSVSLDSNPLAAAARGGHIEAAKLLINAGVPVNPEEISRSRSTGKPPLFYAVSRGYPEMIRLLAEQGANLNFGSADNYDPGPLREAIYRDRENVAMLLIELGADPFREISPRGTTLHLASEKGMEKLVLLILDLGGDVNPRLKILGDTPLDRALHNNHWRTAALLRSRGGRQTIELKMEGDFPPDMPGYADMASDDSVE
jgi:ankyrin repeat protein